MEILFAAPKALLAITGYDGVYFRENLLIGSPRPIIRLAPTARCP